MKTIHGDTSAPLTVREDLAVRGTIREGAVVHNGCSLFVHGNLRGTIAIEGGARLVLAGTLGAFIDRNEGTLCVAGEIATPLEMIPGLLTVAVGTAVTIDGRPRILTAGATLQPATGTTDISLSETDAFAWERQSASFNARHSPDFRELARIFWPTGP